MPSPANNSTIRLPHLARVWLANARATIVREMEFRFNFYSGLIRQLLWAGSFVLLIHVMFQNTAALAGWSQSQVLIILALSRLIEGLSEAMFSRNITNFPATVQDGKFDFFLARPVPAQFHVAFHRFNLLDLGNVIIGLMLLVYAIGISPSPIAPMNWLIFTALAVLAIITYYSLLILIASLVFWLERLDAFTAVSQLITEPLTVPFDIFPSGLKTALTYLLPLAFIVFVPAQALTGRLQLWQIPTAILVTIIFLLLSNLAWRAGLKRYSSASS